MHRIRNVVSGFVIAGAVVAAVVSVGCDEPYDGEPGDNDLPEAVRSGNAEEVQTSQEAGADPSATDVARVLVEAGGQATPPLTCSDSSDPLPLHTAVAEGNSGLSGVLANLCPEDLNEVGTDGRTPLSLAIGAGNEDLVRMLIEAGADPNVPVKPDFRVGTHLTFAVGLGNTEIVEMLLEAGADPNAVDTEQHYDQTPLSLAIAAGNEDLVLMLIEAGADPDVEVNPAFRVTGHVDYAVSLGNTRIVEMLVAETSNESLCYAINGGDLEAVEPLIKSGMDVDSRCEISSTYWYEGIVPLHIATRYWDTAILKLLVDAGADTGIRGSSPLCEAVNHFQVDTVRILVDAGADINERCQSNRAWFHGTTATAIARRYQFTEILDILRNRPVADQSQQATSNSSDHDREALTRLYQATDGQHWIYNDHWLSDQPLSKWYGVTTDEASRVTELSLFANQLIGQLPEALGDVSELRWIDLSANRLAGSIPAGLHHLPELRWLNLADNKLSGSIHPQIGELSRLRQLDLSGNQLTGPIPPGLGDLDHMRELYLYNNQLSGQIPPEIGKLSDLKDLELQHNQLSGEIPSEVGALSNLRVFAVNNNRLTGEIPIALGNLGNLVVLLLHDNQLTGQIPREIGGLSRLTVMALHNNQLSGSLPDTIRELGSLVAVTVCDGNPNIVCSTTNLVAESVAVGIEAVFGVDGVIGQALGGVDGTLGHVTSALTGIGGALGGFFGGAFGLW